MTVRILRAYVVTVASPTVDLYGQHKRVYIQQFCVLYVKFDYYFVFITATIEASFDISFSRSFTGKHDNLKLVYHMF